MELYYTKLKQQWLKLASIDKAFRTIAGWLFHVPWLKHVLPSTIGSYCQDMEGICPGYLYANLKQLELFGKSNS